MARIKKSSHSNSDRWLVSYADLVTLLFAFFVVMFATTQADRSRPKQISDAVNRALEDSTLSPRVTAIISEAVDKKKGRGNAQVKAPTMNSNKLNDQIPQPLDLTSAIQALKTTLSPEIEQGQVGIHMEERGAVISLNTQVVFPSGGDTIDKAIYPVLEKLSLTLNRLPNQIRLEGNADSQPISTQRFRSNWELSVARSISILRILDERYHVNLDRMAVVGYGDTRAMGDNQTAEGRMKNRRVDLVILNDFGKKSEPPNTVPPTGK
jgi:chemotaxis protein MotB